jgi:hypothetical protein
MPITLNKELAQALDQQGELPLAAVHPGKTFFLVSEEQYKRLRLLFEEDPFPHEEQRFQLQQMGKRAAWDDSAMDAYDRYDEHRALGQP